MSDTQTQIGETKTVKRVTVTIPEDVHAKLKTLADLDYRGIGDEFAFLIDQEIARREAAGSDVA